MAPYCSGEVVSSTWLCCEPYGRMPVCMVRGCNTSSRNKTDDIMLHSFPPDKESVKQWLMQMKQTFDDLEGFVEKIVSSTRGTYRICSLHFTPEMYELRGFLPFLKKKDAIPTIFPDCPPMQYSTKNSKKHIASPLSEQRIVTGMFQPEDVISYPLQDFPEFPLEQHRLQMSTPSSEILSALQKSGPTFSRKRKYRPRAIKTIGTMIGFFPGQVHKSTQCDIPTRTKDKSFQIQIRPSRRSVGIQCDISSSTWLTITNKNNCSWNT
ncbi:unnamed protein product [Staurois parvus]|uniref:THAP-type domain-containing protein n=1 Tax=Staurois parvus TaxID=386267 RepID=A0ABN9CPL0_9NEOB|nr:unnamed protein product [Staurois parvus]